MKPIVNVIISSQVGIDLIGPLPETSRGNKYVVMLVDYFSKWPEAAPLPDKTAEGVALFLFELFCRLAFTLWLLSSVHITSVYL